MAQKSAVEIAFLYTSCTRKKDGNNNPFSYFIVRMREVYPPGRHFIRDTLHTHTYDYYFIILCKKKK